MTRELAQEKPRFGYRRLRLGTAPDSIPYNQFEAGTLATRLNEATGDARYRHAALSLAEKIRRENGVRQARPFIEQLIADA